jgi:hypothetical protein
MAAKEETKQHTEEKSIRELTAAERTAIDKYLARCAAKPFVRLKLSNKGSVTTVETDHPNKVVAQVNLSNALGSADEEFLNGIVRQLVNASAHGQENDERGPNFMLSVINGIEPRDQLEAMLAAQMAAVHVASMKLAQILANAETILQHDSAERAFNKLTRTFATQMEALKRYRTGAEQKVTHVSVAEGGQAIVGNVTQAPREKGQEKAATPPPALTDTNVVPMPIMDKSKERAPVSRRRISTR